jgi:hypothetical protein
MSIFLVLFKNSADVEHFVASRANKQPFDLLLVTFQHRMKTTLVAAKRAVSEFFFQFHFVDCGGHEIPLRYLIYH